MLALKYNLSIPNYLRARLMTQLGWPQLQALSLFQDEPIPSLRSENWLLLKTRLCGICGSDLNLLKGTESYSMEPYASFPAILGHEVIATVVQCGDSVAEHRVGDRVAVRPVVSCYVRECVPCEFCQEGLISLCSRSASSLGMRPGMSLGYHCDLGGGWADYLVAHRSQVFSVPKQLSDVEAVLADPMSTAVQAVLSCPSEAFDKKLDVVILGAGTMGLLTVAAIRRLGLPWRVVTVARHDFQKEAALRLGAKSVLMEGGGLEDAFCDRFKTQKLPVRYGPPVFEGGVDLVFDSVGTSKTMDRALRFLKSKGRLTLLATANSMRSVDPTPLWHKEVSLSGVCMSSTVLDPVTKAKRKTFELALELLAKEPIDFLVTHQFPIREHKRALRVASEKKIFKSIKTVFRFDGNTE